jgi:hypothetical protein
LAINGTSLRTQSCGNKPNQMPLVATGCLRSSMRSTTTVLGRAPRVDHRLQQFERVCGSKAGQLGRVGVVRPDRNVDVPRPLVNMATFARRPVLTTNIATLLIGSAMISTFVLVPQLGQLPKGGEIGFGLSATEAGLLLAPGGLASLLIAPFIGRIGERSGSKTPFLAGCLVVAGALLGLALAHGSVGLVVLWSCLVSLAPAPPSRRSPTSSSARSRIARPVRPPASTRSCATSAPRSARRSPAASSQRTSSPAGFPRTPASRSPSSSAPRGRSSRRCPSCSSQATAASRVPRCSQRRRAPDGEPLPRSATRRGSSGPLPAAAAPRNFDRQRCEPA